eukprot:1224828-Rhodomonas_salina.1
MSDQERTFVLGTFYVPIPRQSFMDSMELDQCHHRCRTRSLLPSNFSTIPSPCYDIASAPTNKGRHRSTLCATSGIWYSLPRGSLLLITFIVYHCNRSSTIRTARLVLAAIVECVVMKFHRPRVPVAMRARAQCRLRSVGFASAVQHLPFIVLVMVSLAIRGMAMPISVEFSSTVTEEVTTGSETKVLINVTEKVEWKEGDKPIECPSFADLGVEFMRASYWDFTSGAAKVRAQMQSA